MDRALRSRHRPRSYDDSISPDVYEVEREAIFRRTWLNVGRVEQLPRKGSYVTRELDAAPRGVLFVPYDSVLSSDGRPFREVG